MIKLFSLKQQKRDGEAGKPGAKRASAAQLRIQKGTIFLYDLSSILHLCHVLLF